jgi:hypothetical protein
MTYQRAFLVIDRQQLVMLPDLGADSKRARRSGRTFSNISIVARRSIIRTGLRGFPDGHNLPD